MSPVKTPHNPQGDLFKTELLRIINLNHPLVRLAKEVDWERLDEVFGETYCEDNERPAASTRLMVALHYLKYNFNLISSSGSMWIPRFRKKKSVIRPILGIERPEIRDSVVSLILSLRLWRVFCAILFQMA